MNLIQTGAHRVLYAGEWHIRFDFLEENSGSGEVWDGREGNLGQVTKEKVVIIG